MLIATPDEILQEGLEIGGLFTVAAKSYARH